MLQKLAFTFKLLVIAMLVRPAAAFQITRTEID
jgi:hypothetical protein